MKLYIFAVAFNINGTIQNEDFPIRAKDIGEALIRVKKIRGYISSIFVGFGH